MKIQLDEIIGYIHEHIPITAHLGASIESYDGAQISISAPLAANINHRKSVFGGSLSAVAILSGWSLLFIRLKQAGIQNRLVIQKSCFEYKSPATTDFVATANLPDAKSYEKFLQTFKKRGMARIKITSQVFCSAELCGVHEGTYVVIRN